MGVSQNTWLMIIAFWGVLLFVGFLLNEFRKWLNKKLNKYGINLGKKDDNEQK